MQNEITTRPCEPGDVLAEYMSPTGATWKISVADHIDHPSVGVRPLGPVAVVVGTIAIPRAAGKFVDPSVNVLGWPLSAQWGTFYYDGHRTESCTCETYPLAVARMRELMTENMAKIEAVVAKHEASVSAYAQALAAAACTWPIVVPIGD